MSLAQNYSDASSQNNSDTETNIKHEQNQKENQKAANSHNEVRDPAKEKSKLQSSIFYSARYNDDEYEYRHVILPREYYQRFVDQKYHDIDVLLKESEWRKIGIQQSPGWVHYVRHAPEPHVFMFKRKLPAE